MHVEIYIYLRNLWYNFSTIKGNFSSWTGIIIFAVLHQDTYYPTQPAITAKKVIFLCQSKLYRSICLQVTVRNAIISSSCALTSLLHGRAESGRYVASQTIACTGGTRIAGNVNSNAVKFFVVYFIKASTSNTRGSARPLRQKIKLIVITMLQQIFCLFSECRIIIETSLGPMTNALLWLCLIGPLGWVCKMDMQDHTE